MMTEDTDKGGCVKSAEVLKSTLGTPQTTSSYGDFVLIDCESPHSPEKVHFGPGILRQRSECVGRSQLCSTCSKAFSILCDTEMLGLEVFAQSSS